MRIPQRIILEVVAVAHNWTPLTFRSVDTNLKTFFNGLINRSFQESDIFIAASPVLCSFNIEPNHTEFNLVVLKVISELLNLSCGITSMEVRE